MPATAYVVASAAQLGGATTISQLSQRLGRVSLDVPASKDASDNCPKDRSSNARVFNSPALTAAHDSSPSVKLCFSPMQTDTSTTVLGTPQPPSKSPTRITNVYPRKADVVGQMSLHELTITVEQLDQVVNALARAPLIKSSLQNLYLSFAAVEESSSLYTLSNKQFASCEAQEIAPDLRLVNGRAGGAALFDATAKGNPVTYTFAIQAVDAVRPGSRTYMSLPDDLSMSVRLQYLPPTVDGRPAKVVLQCVHEAFDRKTNKRAQFLSVEDDVTHNFTKAALAELSRVSSVPLEKINVVTDVTAAFNKDEVDWCEVADALQASGESADTVDNTLRDIRSLDASTCAMQTLTLLAELSKVKQCNKDFLVLVLDRDDVTGEVDRVTVPYWSHSMFECLNPVALQLDSSSAKKVTQTIVAAVVDAVRPCAYSQDAFDIGDRSGLTSLFKCIPMFDGSEKPMAWVVSIEPGVKEALLEQGHL